tara:strand:+ start:133 stop:324 length:192 start_codon:yes stop_codon:yes gene_type:complete
MIEVKVSNSLKVIGEFKLIHKDGTEEIINGKKSFCRCGRSGNQPFCDNSHRTRLEVKIEEVPF